MRTRNRKLTWLHRLGTWVLLVALVCALPLSALADGGNFKIAEEVQPKPVVTLQGNLVVENNRLTGFFELALMVRSGRTITDDSGAVITEAQYEALPEADQLLCSFQYFPFESAAASTFINVDALTAVGWDIQEVEYETWTGTGGVGSYAAADTGLDGAAHGYGRGIVSANQSGDPKQITDFPVQDADLNGLGVPPVGLESAGPDEAGTRNAYIEHYDKDNKAALLTLSAETRANTRVVYEEDTPVVVVRFAYDRKRFPNATVGKNGFSLWGGVDPAEPGSMGCGSDETALFYLGSSDAGWGGGLEKSDQLVADGSVGVSVYYQAGVTNPSKPNAQNTHFYYYLGADPVVQVENTTAGRKFYVEGESAQQEAIYPKTASELAVLTAGNVPGIDLATGKYSFFINLLRRSDDTLVIQLVNAETYKKGTGTGGTQILFYDWDDSLIGALIVGGGDVRPQVNQYIEENLVHPDLRTAGLLANMGGNLPDYSTTTPGAGTDEERYQKVLDSVERQYTYRGKYPSVASPAGATGPDIVTDGKEYPLTNKLDYAFYRHINTVTTLEYTDGVSGETIQEKYVTTEPVSKNAEANQYPWVYGWAVVEDNSEANYKDWQVRRDAAKVEDVWTTVGVGELSNVKPSSVQGVPTAGPGGETATVTVEYPEFVNAAGTGVVPTDYAFKVSDSEGNGYLHFADFSDIDGELERLEKANAGSAETMAKDKNVLIVKAVYEPGPELFESGLYQMVKEPYYNKFSNPEAAKGGAYSVEVTMERATEERGPVQGVKRVREPAVRQDTTIDQKWITNAVLGVDHNLDNPDIATAKSLNETTFTKVDTDNGEEITFQLSLSARQNKVDYFIIETYNNNFVSGGQRSLTNYERDGAAHTIDNYNYYTTDSDLTDLYHDVVVYNDREGSHGFVLYGTLNYLMQQATRAKQGEIAQNDFVKGAGQQVLMDANLRTDAAATQPTAATAITIMQPKILDAAQACINNKTADTWNFERNCAELSYHQLQYYILGDPIWTNRAAADAKGISWCHLHAACAAASSGKPTSWQEVVDFAKDSGKADGLSKLLANEIETMTGLRLADGSQYSSPDAFQADVVAAVKAGCESWVEIQYHIIHKAKPASKATALAEARKEYWWYDKSTGAPGTPSSLEDLAAATKDYFEEVALPDGTKEKGWTVKLEPAKTSFDANAGVAADRVERSWRLMTHNLVAEWKVNPDGTEETVKFADWDTFKKAFLDGVELARGAGATPETDDYYWEKLQYIILHRDDTPGITAWPTIKPAESSGYWWKDGKRFLVVKDVPTLLEAIRVANDPTDPDSTALDRVDLNMLENTLHLRGSKTGEKFGTLAEYAGMTDQQIRDGVIAKLTTVKDDPGVTDWESAQYYLAHGAVPTTAQVNGENGYYWWRDGGTGTEGDFSAAFSPSTAQTLIDNLVTAVMRASYGDPKALNQLTDVFGQLHLVSGWTSAGAPVEKSELTQFTVSDFLDAMESVLTKARAAEGKTEEYETPTSLNWWMVQYGLLNNGNYLDSGSAGFTAAKSEYWWYDKEDNKTKDPEPTVKLAGYMQDWMNKENGVTSDTLLKNKITNVNLWKNSYKIYKNSAGAAIAGNVAIGKNVLLKMAQDFKAAIDANPDPTVNLVGTKEGGKYKLDVSWAQIQYYMVTSYPATGTAAKAGTILSNDAAIRIIAGSTASGGWGWVHESSTTGTIKKIPDMVDIPAGISLSGEFEEVPEEELTPEQRMVEIENAIAEQEEIIRNAEARIEALQRLLQQLRNDLLWDNTEETESPGRAEASTTVETPETVEDPEENEPGEPPGERIERPTDVREEIPAGEEFIITVAKGLRRTLL